MKSTGIVRKVDELGRVVIPMELRRNLGIEEKDPLELFLQDNMVVIQKYKPTMACVVTGEVSNQNHNLLDGKLVLSEKGLHVLYKKLEELINSSNLWCYI